MGQIIFWFLMLYFIILHKYGVVRGLSSLGSGCGGGQDVKVDRSFFWALRQLTLGGGHEQSKNFEIDTPVLLFFSLPVTTCIFLYVSLSNFFFCLSVCSLAKPILLSPIHHKLFRTDHCCE